MSIWEAFRKIYYSSLFKNFIYFFSYWLLTLVIHHIFISTAAFFHFQLDHRLGTIEDWIFDKGWQIIIVTKFISAWLILKFISIKSDSRNPLRDIFTKGFRLPDKEIFVFAVFFVLLNIIIGVPKKGELITILIFKPFLSYFGIFFFFISDIFVLNSLKVIHPFSRIQKWLAYLIFSGVIYLFSKMIFLYGLDISFKIYLIAFVSFFLSDWRSSNWTIPAFFLLSCVAPLAAIFGSDPIWKSSYSPLILSNPITSGNLSIIVFVALAYFFYKFSKELNRL